MIASLMHFYPSMKEEDWLKMPYKKMCMYSEYMGYIKRSGISGEHGVKVNDILDRTDEMKYGNKNNNNNNNLYDQLSKFIK